jgi:hypothetical protein
VTDKLDEISALLSQIETIHCSKGHSHTEKKPFRVLYRAWAAHDVADIFGVDITPSMESVEAFDEIVFDVPHEIMLMCGTCREKFPLPEKGQIIWP